MVCSMPGEAELRRKEICLLMMISSSFLKGGLEIATKIRGIWMQQLDLQNTNKNQWVDDLILINIWRAGDSIICGSTANTCSALSGLCCINDVWNVAFHQLSRSFCGRLTCFPSILFVTTYFLSQFVVQQRAPAVLSCSRLCCINIILKHGVSFAAVFILWTTELFSILYNTL